MSAPYRTQVVHGAQCVDSPPHEAALLEKCGAGAMYATPRWQSVLASGLGVRPYTIVVSNEAGVQGYLPLGLVASRLFGRYLVSLPFFSWAGTVASSPDAERALIDHAVKLADELDVKYLQLRHTIARSHAKLTVDYTQKVLSRLSLEGGEEAAWSRLKSTVRTQVRKGRKHDFDVRWGGTELLRAFYKVFARNMRDLGTPVFSVRLFASMLEEFPDDVELCVIRLHNKPVGAAIVVHGAEVSEVPCVSVLREYRPTAVNSFMYWEMIRRCIARGQSHFEFGRSTVGSPTHRFKRKWGTEDIPLHWQMYVRRGDCDAMRPESGKYDRMIRTWQKLPVWLTKIIGPPIVRGIP